MCVKGTAISRDTYFKSLILIPSRSGVDLMSKDLRRSILWDGPVGLRDKKGKFGLFGI